MTNLGHHSLDVVHWIFDLAAPKAVTSSGGRYFLKDNGEVPDTQDAIIEYPKFNAIVQFRECAAGAGSTSMGALTFMGTRGTMTLGRDGFEITPDKKVVWALKDWKDLGPATAIQVLDDPGLPERPGDLQR